MNRTRNFLIMIGVVLVFVICFLALSVITKKPQPAHDFYAGTHKGDVISLSDNYGKSATALIFIDPEIEGSNTVLSKFIARKDKIDVIAVSVSKKTVEEQTNLLPKGWDSIEHFCFEGSDAIEKYNIGNAPMTYFIDKDGYVVDVYPASIKDSSIDKMIEKLK